MVVLKIKPMFCLMSLTKVTLALWYWGWWGVAGLRLCAFSVLLRTCQSVSIAGTYLYYLVARKSVFGHTSSNLCSYPPQNYQFCSYSDFPLQLPQSTFLNDPASFFKQAYISVQQLSVLMRKPSSPLQKHCIFLSRPVNREGFCTVTRG